MEEVDTTLLVHFRKGRQQLMKFLKRTARKGELRNYITGHTKEAAMQQTTCK